MKTMMMTMVHLLLCLTEFAVEAKSDYDDDDQRHYDYEDEDDDDDDDDDMMMTTMMMMKAMVHLLLCLTELAVEAKSD